MLIRVWPRSIRWQMLASLVLLEALSIGLFAALLVNRQTSEIYEHTRQRVGHQADAVALQTKEALLGEKPGWVGLSMKMLGKSPTVALAKVTDPAGNVLFMSKGEAEDTELAPLERAQIPLATQEEARVFSIGKNQWEGMKPIYTGSNLRGFVWVNSDQTWDFRQLHSILRATILFGIIWVAASSLLVLLLANNISSPLAILHRGTRALMNSPDSSSNFPLPVIIHNELGDLIEAFNRMVASIAEQRSGLNDTLSLLDSMLANAPIGLAFFDRSCRFVRVNKVFADLTGAPLSRHLGRTLPELLPQPVSQDLENMVLRVFAQEDPVHSHEFSGQGAPMSRPWTWLVSAYPIRTMPEQVRWVGVIVLDASERRRSEDALRKTEKLAATGRLAASIAHEINNPLEAITNLLFLLKNFCQLDEPSQNLVDMATHEARRISEITQQTLRFYRQSTLPSRAKMSELLDSVLSLYHGRLNGLSLEVVRDYDSEMDLFCFAGEIRQVFANLLGNAIDASANGGRLLLRARRSCNWAKPTEVGVRFTVADTGAGMEHDVKEHIFEPFFTTKESTGTGLGLWVSQEIIVKHRGVVHLRSRTSARGKASGTVFQLFLPDDPNLTGPAKQEVMATV